MSEDQNKEYTEEITEEFESEEQEINESETEPNIVVLAAKTPDGKKFLTMAAGGILATIAIAIIINNFPETTIGAFLKKYNIVMVLFGFLSMVSMQQFSLVANGIRLQQEENERKKAEIIKAGSSVEEIKESDIEDAEIINADDSAEEINENDIEDAKEDE